MTNAARTIARDLDLCWHPIVAPRLLRAALVMQHTA